MSAAPLVHEALIYRSDEELLAATVPFLRDGLAAGEPALLGVDPRLQALILDAVGADAGVTLLDPRQYAQPFRAINLYHGLYTELVGQGARQVRAVGTVPGARETWHGWSRYEAAINHAVAELPVWAICLYDTRETSDEVLVDVARTHTHLATPAGEHHLNARYVDPERFLTTHARTDVDRLERTPPRLELHQPSPTDARHAIVALRQGTTLGRATTEGLALAVTEVVTNAILHGRPPVGLRAWQAPDRVVVAVHDAGPGPDDPWVGMLPPALDATGGRGLNISYQACSEVTLEAAPDGFTVHLVARED